INDMRLDNYVRATGAKPAPETEKGEYISKEDITARIKAAAEFAKASAPPKATQPNRKNKQGRGNRYGGYGFYNQYPQQGQQQAGQQQYQPAYPPYVQQAATNPGYQTQTYTDNSGQSAQQNFQQGGRGRGRGRGSTRQ
ncbi:hypothetical protein BGZ79_005484, partial [Entomortierella chlamydospora]